MEDLSERAVQIARARYPGRPEVARAVSLRFQTGDVPAHVLAGHLTAGPKAADALVSPEVRQDMRPAAFIDRVAQALPTVAPTVVQPVESGLIEREFYPLDTLAARWRCTPNDIVHLGGTGAAQVCANIYGLACHVTWTRISAPDEVPDEDMPDGVIELTPETLRVLELPGSFPFDLDDGFKYCRRSWWAYEFNLPVPIQHGHLCVLRAEVARLDAEVFSAVLGERVETGGAAARTESTAVRPRDDCEMKKDALIQKYAGRWPSINSDFGDTVKNGLRAAAGGTKRGWWWEGAALEWARVRGKLNNPAQVRSSVFKMGRETG